MSEPWGLGLGAAFVLGAALGLPGVLLVTAVAAVAQAVRGRRHVVFLAAIALFATLGLARVASGGEAQSPASLGDSTGGQVRVTTLPRSARSGEMALLAVDTLRIDDQTIEIGDVTVLGTFPVGERLAPGDRLDVEWYAQPLEMLDPGYGSYVASLGAQGTARVGWVPRRDEGSSFLHWLVDLRFRIGDNMRAALPGDPGALASGLVTGDDSRLSERAVDAFRQTGTSHITAVSGANIAMLVAIWNLVIPAGRNRRLLGVQMVVIGSIWLYAVLVGLEPPALRAGIMASLMLLASRSGRRSDVLTLLALTSAALVLWNPDYVRMTGFWLSVVATGAIVSRIPTEVEAGWRSMLRATFEGVVLAQVATLPIVLASFGTWSLTSIAANLILAPIMWLAFPLSFLLAAIVLLAAPVAPLVGWLVGLPLRLTLVVVDSLAGMAAPLDFISTGAAGVLAVGLPCVVVLALMSVDLRRWEPMLADSRNRWPMPAWAMAVGPAVGLVLAGIVIVVWS